MIDIQFTELSKKSNTIFVTGSSELAHHTA